MSQQAPPRCNNFEASSKRLIKTPNNNGEVPANKLVIDEQFKNNAQKCFLKISNKKFSRRRNGYSQETTSKLC